MRARNTLSRTAVSAEVPFDKEDVADQAMVSAIVKEYRIDAVLHFAVKKSGSPIRWRTR